MSSDNHNDTDILWLMTQKWNDVMTALTGWWHHRNVPFISDYKANKNNSLFHIFKGPSKK